MASVMQGHDNAAGLFCSVVAVTTVTDYHLHAHTCDDDSRQGNHYSGSSLI